MLTSTMSAVTLVGICSGTPISLSFMESGHHQWIPEKNALSYWQNKLDEDIALDHILIVGNESKCNVQVYVRGSTINTKSTRHHNIAILNFNETFISVQDLGSLLLSLVVGSESVPSLSMLENDSDTQPLNETMLMSSSPTKQTPSGRRTKRVHTDSITPSRRPARSATQSKKLYTGHPMDNPDECIRAEYEASLHPVVLVKQIKSVSPDDGPGPCFRWAHAMMLIDNKLWLFGGQREENTLASDDMFSYDLEISTWTRYENNYNTVKCRSGHSLIQDPLTQEFLLYGGARDELCFGDVHRYDITTHLWRKMDIDGKGPVARSFHSATLVNRMIIVFGGIHAHQSRNDVQILDLDRAIWYKPPVSGSLPLPRSGHTATLMDEELIVFGGWDEYQYFNDLLSLDLCLYEFNRLSAVGNGPTPRCWHAAASWPGRPWLLVFGGHDGNIVLNDLFLLEISKKRWHLLSSSLLSGPRAGASIFVISAGHSDAFDCNTEYVCSNATGLKDQVIMLVYGGGNTKDNFEGGPVRCRLSVSLQ